jgi:hypothetical protein
MAWTGSVGHDPDLCPYGQRKHEKGDGGDEFVRGFRFGRTPGSLRRAGVHVDNVVLVPASLLPYKK